MTEISSILTTYSIPNSYPVTALPASASPIPNGNFSPTNAAEEEEYTIKCICGYNDDDGNTVFCEKCDTWQHIECYYHGKKVPEIHFCTDCAPKDTFADINPDKARERQRRARELLDGGGDRRVKRPASKGQKKKRDTIADPDQPNGWPGHDRQGSLSAPKDQPPPAKKPKTSHRASGSIASLNGESRKRAHSNVQSYPSPSKSPQELHRYSSIPHYTSEFLELYDRDDGSTDAKDNEHTISGSLALSAWKKDPSLVASYSENLQNDKPRFVRAEGEWNEHGWPSVTVEKMANKDTDSDAKQPTWKLLRLQSDVRKNTIVGEIRGEVGTLDEYCQQLTGPNRWKDLSHPDPFVFFHPHMDIYIDSRRSGTRFRYIRRSCDPNVTMRSYITPDDEVHHCFVAKEDIPAGAELTASWYLSTQLFVNDKSRDDKEQLFQERCDYISRVLANFGDCACGLPKCRLSAFDRRNFGKTVEPPKQSVSRKKKTKTKHAISPLSTGQATNSRAGSETIKGQDDEDDRRSSSDSSRNGVHSRDLTPQGGALLDEPPMLGAGLTQREIRKIQALEKASKEQSQKGEKKQKKRPSGASNFGTPVPTSKHSDLKRFSGSPPPHRPLMDVSNRSTPSKSTMKPVRPVYVDAFVQTDPEVPEEMEPSLKRRKFCTPTQRLLKRLLNHRAQCQAGPLPSNHDREQQKDENQDVEMKDADTSISTTTSPTLENGSQSEATQTPLPSQAAHTIKIHGVFKTPAPRLNLSNLPPVPMFPNFAPGTPGSSTNAHTSNLVTSSMAQSPRSFSGPSITSSTAVNPSPAKKKLSLEDYMSRRKESATPSTERPAMGTLDVRKDRQGSDAKSEPDLIAGAVSEVHMTIAALKSKAADNEVAVEDALPLEVSDTIQPKVEDLSNGPHSRSVSAEVQNVLSSLQQMQDKQGLGPN